MNLVKYIIIYFILYFDNLIANQNDFNPYETLGLSRTASDQEIRQSYKKLAKIWHPDKNSEPNANDQFTKISAAYEILSDPKKRKNYDDYGTTSEDNRQDFNTNHFRDPFDMFRTHFFQETPSGAKKIINADEFLKNILPNSDKKPYLIFGSTNFCFDCRKPLTIFRSMEKQLNDVGIGTGEFNINDERLSSELGIIDIPSLCAISQGRVYHFDDQDYSETNIKEFIRKSIPIKRFIKILNNYDEILTMITSYNQSNRVHALLITKQKKITLKFVIPCLQYSTRIECAVFNSSVIKTDRLPAFLKQVYTMSDTILLFKEDLNQADIVIRDNDFNLNYIQKTFESNQLLYLSTITSPNVFNLVCQINSAKPCFLIIGDTNLFSRYRSIFIHLSKELFQEFKTHMAYLDLSSTKQVEFNKILSSYYNINEKKLLILVIRRLFNDKIEIQNTNIDLDEKSLNEFQHNQISIKENLKLFLNIHWKNAKKYTLPTIFNFDERNQNIIDQFQNKWNYWIERNRLLRYLSGYLYTYRFWLITIFIFVCMYYPRREPEQRNNNTKKSKKINQMKIYEFNESLIQYYTDPRAPNVIILLLIADTPKDLCVKNFKQEINAIKKDSRIIFSIIFRQQSSQWLDELLNKLEDTQNKQSIEFSPSNILALYIRRKYFVSYRSIYSNNNVLTNQSNSTLTFSDWIDLLFDGNFREPIRITEWPMKFH